MIYLPLGKGLFEINKPRVNGIGFDALPDYILNSKEFSGNELAKLAGVESIPTFVKQNYSNNKDELIAECKKLLFEDKVNDAWQLVLQLGSILIEK